MITKERLHKAVKGELIKSPQANPQVVENSSKALAAIGEFQKQLEALTVITPDQYVVLDRLRADIEQEIEWWDTQTDPIVKPLRAALDATYSLSRTVKRPLERLKETARLRMEQYKLDEARQIRASEEAKEKEKETIQSDLDELKLRRQQAATPQLKKKLDQRINTLQEKVVEVEQETPAPIQAEGSSARFGYEWELTDIKEVARAVAEGKIPAEALGLNNPWINKHFSQHPNEVMEWPGFKVVEAVSIVKTRRI